MQISKCTRVDYDIIVSTLPDYWGHDENLKIHHPLFIEQFGDTAFVIHLEGKVAAYLFGFFTPDNTSFYIHLIGVRSTCRRQKLASSLYKYIEALCRKRNTLKLIAITSPNNKASQHFHIQQGFKILPTSSGARIHAHYAGPGRDMCLLYKQIGIAS